MCDHPGIEARKQADTLAQGHLEIQFSVHGPRGDGRDVRTDARLGGQLVNAFLGDHGGIHIGQQQPLASAGRGLNRKVNAHALQAVPHIPEVRRFRGKRKLRRHARGEPARIAATPGVAETFDRDPVKPGGGGIAEQSGHEHDVSDSGRGVSRIRSRGAH